MAGRLRRALFLDEYFFNRILRLQVKAYNTKGHSEYSQETVAMTKVDRIPAPQRVTFDPVSHTMTINIGATCLQLVRTVFFVFVRFSFDLIFNFNFFALLYKNSFDQSVVVKETKKCLRLLSIHFF